MRMRAWILAAALSAGGSAWGQDEPAEEPAPPAAEVSASPGAHASYPVREVDRPTVLPLGVREASTELAFGISKGQTFGDSVDLLLDGAWGFRRRLDAGAGAVLMVLPEGNTFRALDLHAQYQLRGPWAARVDLEAIHAPGDTQFGFGVAAPFKHKLGAGLAVTALERLLTVYASPSASLLTLPVGLHVQAMGRLAVGLRAAFELPDFDPDLRRLPVRVYGQYTMGARLDFGASVALLDVSANAGGAFDGRAINLFAALRF